MKKIKPIILSTILALLFVIPLQAQEMNNNIKAQFDGQFNYVSRVLQLAKEMPADTYSWRPAEGVRSVGEVYVHIAQANYMMMNALGVSLPEGVDVQGMGSLTDKEDIVEALEQCIEFTRSSVQDLSDSKLGETVQLFGQTPTGQGVLIMLLSHMSEHVGQSIAYARTNDVTPPWSQGQ